MPSSAGTNFAGRPAPGKFPLVGAVQESKENGTNVPIYEYYCPDNHRIYQFFAKTQAQGRKTPKCPDNPAFKMERVMSSFAITGGGKPAEGADAAQGGGAHADPGGEPEDPKMEAAFDQLEHEMGSVDENDPRAMGHMMRHMAELTGEKLDGEMEEVVRKLEEGKDPDQLEEEFGGAFPDDGAAGEAGLGGVGRGRAPSRDPNLYDYD